MGLLELSTNLTNLTEMTEPNYEWNGTEYVTDNGVPIVWVDGSCLNNGRSDAKSGIGVWASENDNWSRPNYKYPSTSQFAEIYGAEDAVRTYKKRREDELQVRSDSAYLNDCMHTYIHKWLNNDWITAQGHEAVHREPLENIWQLMDSITVDFVWIDRAGRLLFDRQRICSSHDRLT